MKRASIDLGTNTCLLLVVEWDDTDQKIVEVLEDRSTLVRLGQGVDKTHELNKNAVGRTLDCLAVYSGIVGSYDIPPRDVVCVATSQARDAKNGAEFFSKIHSKLGFSFEVLSGEMEANLSFLGALDSDRDPQKHVVIDIGGGSTEVVGGSFATSIDMGAVRFTERFLTNDPVDDESFWRCQRTIDDEFSKLIEWRVRQIPDLSLVAVAGTAVTLARWFLGESITDPFDPKKISEVTLTRGDLHRMVEELKWRTVEERKKLPGIEPGRADVILAGALILWRCCEMLSFPEVSISARGLRYGILHR